MRVQEEIPCDEKESKRGGLWKEGVRIPIQTCLLMAETRALRLRDIEGGSPQAPHLVHGKAETRLQRWPAALALPTTCCCWGDTGTLSGMTMVLMVTRNADEFLLRGQ